MNDFKHTPASMRYLGARLKPFRRPLFWGSLGLASLIGFTLYQYWRHPDWLSGNLSEIRLDSNSSINNSSASINREQIPAEDLAIGAELDNLDLLLKELAQNQTIPLNQSKKSQNSLPKGNKDTTYHRFQEQQKAKFRQPPQSLIPNKINTNDLVQSPTRKLFKPPSLTGYNSNDSNSQNSTSSTPQLIPNPVGRLYLADRDRLNKTFTPSPANSFSPTTPIIINQQTPQNPEANASSPNNPNASSTEIGLNTEATNTFVTPSVIPYNDNINRTPVTSRPVYGQPIYQQPTNFGVNSGVVGDRNRNTLPTRFPPNNLSNQEQTQQYYQLTPSNYQLQPQRYNQQNLNTGFNSQPNSFSSSESFSNSPFNFGGWVGDNSQPRRRGRPRTTE